MMAMEVSQKAKGKSKKARFMGLNTLTDLNPVFYRLLQTDKG